LPHTIRVSHDGVAYAADRINNRIQVFTREGKFLQQARMTNEGSIVVPVPAGFASSRTGTSSSSMSSTPGRCTQISVVGTKGANADEFDIVHQYIQPPPVRPEAR
jgi:hypothetical protein